MVTVTVPFTVTFTVTVTVPFTVTFTVTVTFQGNFQGNIIQGKCINYIVKTQMTSFQKVFIEHQYVKVYIQLLWRRFINVYICNKSFHSS